MMTVYIVKGRWDGRSFIISVKATDKQAATDLAAKRIGVGEIVIASVSRRDSK